MTRERTRRAALRRGGIALAAAIGIAGCSSDRSTDGRDGTPDPTTDGTASEPSPTAATTTSPGERSTTEDRATPAPGIDRAALADRFPAIAGSSPTYRATPARTGARRGPAPGPDLAPRWRVDLAAGTRGVAVADGRVVFGTTDGRVIALSAADGRPRWTAAVGRTIRSVPAIDDGTVYVASAGGRIAALSLATGAVAWTTELAVPLYSCPAVADGRVYLGAKYGVYALSAADGTTAWAFRNGERFEGSSPAVAAGRVAIGSGGRAPESGRSVYCLDAATGRRRWAHETAARVWSTPAIVGDGTGASMAGAARSGTPTGRGRVYVGVDDGTADGGVLALSLADGAVAWRGDRGVVGPVTVAGDRLLVPGDPIRAHALGDGRVAWRAGAGTPLVRGDLAVAGGAARSVADGRRRCSVPTPVSPARVVAVTENAAVLLARPDRVGAAGRRLVAVSAPP